MKAFAIKILDRGEEFYTKSYTEQVRLYTQIGHARGVVKMLAESRRNHDISACIMAALLDDSDDREDHEKRRVCRESALPIEEYKKNYKIITYDLVEVDQE